MTEPAKTLVADPPWPFKDKLPGKGRGAVKHYSLLTLNEIAAHPLPELAKDCRLFLWRVAAMGAQAELIARAWGFEPKAELVWIKETKNGKAHFGMGRQVRNAHETCLIATKGRPQQLSKSIRSTFSAPTGRHSEKPMEFYDLVETLSPGPYTEIFARRRRYGWASYGDELPPEEELHVGKYACGKCGWEHVHQCELP